MAKKRATLRRKGRKERKRQKGLLFYIKLYKLSLARFATCAKMICVVSACTGEEVRMLITIGGGCIHPLSAA